MKKLSSKASTKSIDRICRSMKTTKALMESFDAEEKSYKPSGKHVGKSSAIKQLSRSYNINRHWSEFLGGLIAAKWGLSPAGFDSQKMYRWID